MKPLPVEFIQHWQSLVFINRTCARAHRMLQKQWSSGKSIPGHSVTGTPDTHMPEGWSLANLRRHAPAPETWAARATKKI